MNLKRLIFCLFLWVSTYSFCAPVHFAEAITIGGLHQWITIKGASEKDPIILFLHGGPGSSAMNYADRFTAELQKKFLVVQWDQRETGKTKQLNHSPFPLTIALFENDAVEVIGYLKTRFSKDKIYLMGHSWGGFLGLSIAAKHPELLLGYFAISPMVWQEESERQVLDSMRMKAQRENNVEEQTELSAVSIPFANGQQLYYQRKWMAKWMKQKPISRSFVEKWAERWLPLFNEACRVNFFTKAPEIQCPIYFFLGDADYQTFFRLTAEYYKTVKAPRKEIFWFHHSAHAFLFSEQKKLQEIILRLALLDNPN